MFPWDSSNIGDYTSFLPRIFLPPCYFGQRRRNIQILATDCMGVHRFTIQLLCGLVFSHERRFDHPINAQRFLWVSICCSSCSLSHRLFRSKKFNFFKMVFVRYMRLTPSVAVMILVDRALAEFMMNEHTPSEFLDYSVRPCEKNWWMTLLHINGYVRADQMVRAFKFLKVQLTQWTTFQCMMTTWYISIEWQLTVFVAPVLIYLLNKHENLGLASIISLIAGSAIGVGVWFGFYRQDVAADNIM
jgi:hypothetical protein